MSTATKTLSQLRKAGKLTNRAMHENGPRSYKRGQGALLKVLYRHEGEATSRELVNMLGFDRSELKDVVKKAERNGYVEILDVEQKRTYAVKLTEKGGEIAEHRCAAHTQAADQILSVLTAEEVEQLNALTEKVILSCKEQGARGAKKTHSKAECACC